MFIFFAVGWATHTFLRMLEENRAQSSSMEIDTEYLPFNRGHSESNNDQDDDTIQDLEAMVNSKRY